MQTIPYLGCVESRRCRANFIREIQHKVSPVHTRKYEQHFQTAHKHIHTFVCVRMPSKKKLLRVLGSGRNPDFLSSRSVLAGVFVFGTLFIARDRFDGWTAANQETGQNYISVVCVFCRSRAREEIVFVSVHFVDYDF